MPQGGVIKIRAENIIRGEEDRLALKDGRYIKITVEDEGIEIAKEHLSKIFDPYFTTKQRGGGLGLATAYSIIKGHDGYIEVESQLGVGTKFYIYIPASDKEVLSRRDMDERVVEGRGRVLVMDDEEIVRDVAGEMLSQIGYNVDYAKDGAEAIEKYIGAKQSDKPFDLIIMDLTIPGGMGGKEAIEKLMGIDPGVRAVVSSGYSNDPVMSEHRKYGFRGVISKPYNIEELTEVLHRVITEQ